jgi:hypothetical protein
MLPIAILALLIGAVYAVHSAPREQKALVGGVLVGLAIIGYGAGFALTDSGTDQRTYYPIAGAVAGAMVAFMWISRRQKSWPKPGDKT